VKRGVLIGFGVLLLLLGMGLVAAGATVAAVLGPTESISTTPSRIHGTGVALVADGVTVDQGSVPVPSGLGRLSLTVSAPDGRQMFAGVAPPAAVDTYLTGAPYDVIVDLSSAGTSPTRSVPGTQQPPRPGEQKLWTARASGSPASLSSGLSATSSLVVMNADASPGVTADVVVTLVVPGAWVAAWTAVGVGVLVLVLAGLAFWRARVARRRRLAQRALVQQAVAPPVTAPAMDAAPLAAEPLVTAVGDAVPVLAEQPGTSPTDDATDGVDDPDPDPVEDDPADDDAEPATASLVEDAPASADAVQLAAAFGLTDAPAPQPDPAASVGVDVPARPSAGTGREPEFAAADPDGLPARG
jgi:hypothetical protein